MAIASRAYASSLPLPSAAQNPISAPTTTGAFAIAWRMLGTIPNAPFTASNETLAAPVAVVGSTRFKRLMTVLSPVSHQPQNPAPCARYPSKSTDR